MIAVTISQFGGPEVLKPSELPKPIPSDHEVLIKVQAAGINRPDAMQRQGLYPPPIGASETPGLEVAGIVAGYGNKVKHMNIGDKVCALLTGGGYAEYCLADQALCLPTPRGLSIVEAAALPETFYTVWSNLFDRAKLSPKETLLVHGGASGIGTTAIQLADAFAAKVIVTAGTETKCRFCESIGAMAAINYRKQNFVEEIAQLTNNEGVDVILDIIGADYFPRNLSCMAKDARLLQIAIQNGPKSEINLLSVMLNRLTITGSTLRARSVDFKAAIAQNLLNHVWPLLEQRRIKPIVFKTFALTEAAQAHALLESGQHIGKIVLTVSE